MKIFIDTNILFSASLFPESRVAQAYRKAVSGPHQGVTSDYVIEELNRAYRRKAPGKVGSLAEFLLNALPMLAILPTPKETLTAEKQIRDKNDRPIFRTAAAAQADIILTGDLDLLESGITKPMILSPSEFLERFS